MLDETIKQHIEKLITEMAQRTFLNTKELVIQEIGKANTNLAEALDKHFFRIQDFLNNHKEILIKEREMYQSNMEVISTETVHKIVNGSLRNINDKLTNIQEWQIKHDNYEIIQSNLFEKKITQVSDKTIYGALVKNMDARPLRTFIAIMLTAIIFISIVVKIFNASMFDLIESILKLF